MIEIFLNLFIFWFIYSFFGWVVEVIWANFRKLGYEVRNKAMGPINPGYGIAAIVLITLLNDFKDNPLFVFIVGGLISTILEFFAHWFFERFAGVRLWDYSHRRFNIQGRVCLGNSLLFGLLCVLMINLVHPYLGPFVLQLPINFKFIFTFIAALLYAIEWIIIIVAVAGLKSALNEIATLWDIIKNINPEKIPSFREYMKDIAEESSDWYKENKADISDDFIKKYDFTLDLENSSLEDEENIIQLRLSQIIEEKFTQRNIYEKILYRVFPDLKSTDHKEIFEVMKDTYLK